MTEMTTERAIEVLEAHNEWRRDNEVPSSKEMVNPKELGEALDKAIEVMGYITQLEGLVEQVKVMNSYDIKGNQRNSKEYCEGWNNACNIIEFRVKNTLAGYVAKEKEL